MAVDDLLDVPAAAGHVGCSVGTIRYRMRRVGLAPTLRMGTSLFFTKEDLDAHFGLSQCFKLLAQSQSTGVAANGVPPEETEALVRLAGLASHILQIPDFATELAAMIGLGVGIDYALFIFTRFRNGLDDGLEWFEPPVGHDHDRAGNGQRLRDGCPHTS